MDNPHKLSALLLGIGAMLTSPAAFAYLDPSTSGMIISAIVGLFASAALAIKTYWYRIKAFFRPNQPGGGANDGAIDGSGDGNPS